MSRECWLALFLAVSFSVAHAQLPNSEELRLTESIPTVQGSAAEQTAESKNPCLMPHRRALVLGGGGSKGAFAAGAAYHVIVHRQCDFTEIAGTSVGALNGVILAQAARSEDAAVSQLHLSTQAEALVHIWSGLRGSNDISTNRRFGSLRFGLFGAESLKEFKPLYRLLQRHVDMERLPVGRELRIGTVSFHDGSYREVVLNRGGIALPNSIDYVFASAVLPMFGKMPRLPAPTPDGKENAVQFGDGSLRHIIPVASYFRSCVKAQGVSVGDRCKIADGIPPHPPIEQLFVVANTPFQRRNDFVPTLPTMFKPGTQQITDGRKIMSRAIGLVMNTIYNTDMELLFSANELLEWRQIHVDSLRESGLEDFPLESYNYDESTNELFSHPYQLAVIVPKFEDGDMSALLDFSPTRIARQMYCGCLAANLLFETQFADSSLEERCAERFRPARTIRGKEQTYRFHPSTCDAYSSEELAVEARPATERPTRQDSH